MASKQSIPICILCKQGMVHHYDRYRCTTVGGNIQTKLGETFYKVVRDCGINVEDIAGSKIHNNMMLCKRCRELVLRIERACMKLNKIRKELKDKMKPPTSTGYLSQCFRSVSGPTKQQKRPLTPTQCTGLSPATKQRPQVPLQPKKRSLSSPQATQGISKAADLP